MVFPREGGGPSSKGANWNRPETVSYTHLDVYKRQGTGYVMRRVIAEVSPAKILAAAPRSLVADLGRELALIHALPRAAIPAEIPVMVTAAALAELKARFLSYGGDRPAIALAVKWCEDHLPEPADPVLVHGDYRMGCLLYTSRCV